jgi:hypothetical protein
MDMGITVSEFRQACNTLVRFTQQYTGLAEEERTLVLMVIRSLEYTLAPSAALDIQDRGALARRLINHPLLDPRPKQREKPARKSARIE